MKEKKHFLFECYWTNEVGCCDTIAKAWILHVKCSLLERMVALVSNTLDWLSRWNSNGVRSIRK